MSRVWVSATVDADRLADARELTGAGEVLALLVRGRLAEQGIAAITADHDLAWPSDLTYDGEIPAEVLTLAEARRR